MVPFDEAGDVVRRDRHQRHRQREADEQHGRMVASGPGYRQDIVETHRQVGDRSTWIDRAAARSWRACRGPRSGVVSGVDHARRAVRGTASSRPTAAAARPPAVRPTTWSRRVARKREADRGTPAPYRRRSTARACARRRAIRPPSVPRMTTLSPASMRSIMITWPSAASPPGGEYVGEVHRGKVHHGGDHAVKVIADAYSGRRSVANGLARALSAAASQPWPRPQLDEQNELRRRRADFSADARGYRIEREAERLRHRLAKVEVDRLPAAATSRSLNRPARSRRPAETDGVAEAEVDRLRPARTPPAQPKRRTPDSPAAANPPGDADAGGVADDRRGRQSSASSASRSKRVASAAALDAGSPRAARGQPTAADLVRANAAGELRDHRALASGAAAVSDPAVSVSSGVASISRRQRPRPPRGPVERRRRRPPRRDTGCAPAPISSAPRCQPARRDTRPSRPPSALTPYCRRACRRSGRQCRARAG